MHSRDAYPTPEDFLVEVRDYEQALVRDLIDLGCDYVQLDAPNYGFICDPRFREEMADTGRDLAADIRFDAELDSSVFDGVALTRAIHLCRGNSAGMWAASGGYEAVADQLFPRLTVDRLLLEYDTPRSGDFGALEHVPDHVTVVLGLLTTKQGALENADAVEGRIHEAEQIVPLDRLALSPQCGFASVASGNPLTPAEQAEKLRLVGDLARRGLVELRRFSTTPPLITSSTRSGSSKRRGSTSGSPRTAMTSASIPGAIVPIRSATRRIRALIDVMATIASIAPTTSARSAISRPRCSWCGPRRSVPAPVRTPAEQRVLDRVLHVTADLLHALRDRRRESQSLVLGAHHVRDGQGRDERRAGVGHQDGRLLVEPAPVLEALDPGLESVLDAGASCASARSRTCSGPEPRARPHAAPRR